MAIAYPLAMPDCGIRTISLELQRSQSSSFSPFTRSSQVYDWGGAAWNASITLAPMKNETAAEWEGFLLSLNGMVGTFRMGDPLRSAPAGTQQVDIEIAAAAAAGVSTIDVQGMDAGATLLAADPVEIGGRLHKITQSATADALGLATLEIAPALRAAVAPTDPVSVVDAKTSWRLTSPDIGWQADVARFYGFSFSASEVL